MKAIQTETFLPGILTPDEIIRAHYSRIGKMGAASSSQKLQDARRRNLKKARSARSAKLREARRQGKS